MDHISSWLTPLLGIVSTLLLGVIGHSIKTPKDHERAQLLTHLAQEVATVVLALTPDAPWKDLVRDIVSRLAAIAAVPTKDATILERAATSALVRLGKSPPA